MLSGEIKPPLRILVVEDSPVTANILRDILSRAEDLQVVQIARHGVEALEALKTCSVDVVTLDVNMPHMDGIETLREIVRLYQLPCLMVSSLTRQGARSTLDALQAGAVDFFTKPRSENPTELVGVGALLQDKVRLAARCDMSAFFEGRPELVRQRFRSPPIRDLVVMGASTGGPRALDLVLSSFPSDLPARILVGQHLPPGFSSEFARHLDATSPLTVREAKDETILAPGTVLVAPAGLVTKVERRGTNLITRVMEPVGKERYTPSVDTLLSSAAAVHGSRTIGVVLTGMGDDGAQGMQDLHDAGGATLAESERSSIVFNMPRSAIELGVVRDVVSKEMMAEEILHRMMV
jgi:two-component system chemotaxis response regulator CheB